MTKCNCLGDQVLNQVLIPKGLVIIYGEGEREKRLGGKGI